MRRFGLLVVFVLGALVLGSCGDDGDADDPTAATDGGAADPTAATAAGAADPSPSEQTGPPPPAPSEPGPFAVGRRTETVTDATRDDRTLTVEVWYPAAETADADPTPYELVPGVTFPAELSTVDLTPAGDGPFPLVVFSHGSGGLRQQTADVVETIASHGFVVVAPDHVGNTAVDQLLGTATEFDESARNRVADVGFLLDEVDAGRLAADLTDLDDVAVMGHSFGGFTALAAAGGYEGTPADPRVDAIVPLAPASRSLSDDELASIDVPMLIITGGDDQTTPVEPQSTRPLDLATGPATLVVIEGGSHEVVTNVCDILDAVTAAEDGLPPGAVEAAGESAGETCDPDAPVSVDEAFDIVEAHAVSFLRLHLTGDERYAEVAPIDKAEVRTA